MELKYEPNRFENLEQAKEFYYDRFGKYDKEFIYVGDELILLCCTSMAYDDEIWWRVDEMFGEMLREVLDVMPKNRSFSGCIDSIFEDFMRELEDYGNFKVEYLYDEF